MKKILYVALCIASCSYSEGNSRSFYNPRQISSDVVFESAQTRYDIWYRSDGGAYPFKWFVKPFYQHSTGSEEFSRYFFPGNRQCISVQQNGLGDVDSLWLGLINETYQNDDTLQTYTSDYHSCLCMAPERVTHGTMLQLFFDLDRAIPRTWIEFNTAFMHAHTRMNLDESGGATGSVDGIVDASDAFNNCEWCAGKICSGTMRLNGVDDIQIKLGYDFYCTETSHIAAFGLTSIPTGRRRCNEYLFEPIIGSRSASIGLGVNGSS